MSVTVCCGIMVSLSKLQPFLTAVQHIEQLALGQSRDLSRWCESLIGKLVSRQERHVWNSVFKLSRFFLLQLTLFESVAMTVAWNNCMYYNSSNLISSGWLCFAILKKKSALMLVYLAKITDKEDDKTSPLSLVSVHEPTSCTGTRLTRQVDLNKSLQPC